MGTYSNLLKLNAPSIYTFVRSGVSVEAYSTMGILAAFFFTFAVILFLYIGRSRLDNRSLFTAALIFAAAIPLLLPHMHERYYFMADVMAVIYACISPRRFFLPIFVVTASFGGYYAYFSSKYIFDMRIGTVLLILTVLVLLFDLWRHTHGSPAGVQAVPGS
jgi:hypothetical protein